MTSEEIIPPGEDSEEGKKSTGLPEPPPEIMPQEQQPQQMQQQVPFPDSYPPYYPQRKKSFFESLVKNPTMIGTMIVVALALMWLGVTILAIGFASGNAGGFAISVMVYSIGTAFLVILLLGLGIGRHDYPQWVRFALILVAGIIVVWGFYLGGAIIGALTGHYSP